MNKLIDIDAPVPIVFMTKDGLFIKAEKNRKHNEDYFTNKYEEAVEMLYAGDAVYRAECGFYKAIEHYGTGNEKVICDCSDTIIVKRG